jgi:rhodanese-related sulfurtransferase
MPAERDQDHILFFSDAAILQRQSKIFEHPYRISRMSQPKLSRWQLLKSQLNNLEPEAFQSAWETDDDAVLIDCRSHTEVAGGKIPGAINIDYLTPDFWEQLEQLDAERSYYVYCRSGRRSIRTCTLMQNGGFSKVYNLDGGLNGWIAVFGVGALLKEDTCLD